LNTELFIAKRVFSEKQKSKGIASKIVSIAVASISIGIVVMIVSVSVLLGFKHQIREKVIGFGSHYQIVNYDTNFSYETKPIRIDSQLIAQYKNLDQVRHLQFFATKPGIIKTDEAIHGIVLKGAGANYDWNFFKNNIIDGEVPSFQTIKTNNQVLISEEVAQLLKLKTGDYLYCYFFNQGDSSPRNRRFVISGIYKTNFTEFDQLFVIADLRHVQQLNGWHSTEITGYELMIHDFEKLEQVFDNLQSITLNNASEKSMLRVFSIDRKYPTLFDWLEILDMNVWLLIILMIAVAGINMISGLIIIIIERSRMIGILKALGYPNFSVRKVFIYLTAFLSGKGLFWGNILGIGLCIIQYYTGIIKLDASSYYLETVPIVFNFTYIVLLNIGTLIAIVCMIILPSMFISRISPVEAISFE
jgi:lipoprotein-releasing system permease protein